MTLKLYALAILSALLLAVGFLAAGAAEAVRRVGT
jgi:hypothetical protein